MRARFACICALLGFLGVRPLHSQDPVYVAPNAAPDRPIPMDSCLLAATDSVTAPLVSQARASYPAAKTRYLAGLPPRHSFFVVTYLRDSLDQKERVFIAVDSLESTSGPEARIYGRIWNDINLVHGFVPFQAYSFAQADLLDWMFSRPDGTEEGNLIGKFLETWEPPAACHP